MTKPSPITSIEAIASNALDENASSGVYLSIIRASSAPSRLNTSIAIGQPSKVKTNPLLHIIR
ncbi:MAG: hypothetical protein KME38_22585 [Spirirestis rafaelensis WJT71-NPBG6]|nr:hypothetical protein [Spirirestis rafaelensis WJT71-NPBG6]